MSIALQAIQITVWGHTLALNRLAAPCLAHERSTDGPVQKKRLEDDLQFADYDLAPKRK